MRPTSSGHLVRQALAAALIAAALAIAVLGGTHAAAAPSNAKIRETREQAIAARDRLDDLAADLEERSEEYLGVQQQLEVTSRDLREAEDELVDAEAEQPCGQQ